MQCRVCLFLLEAREDDPERADEIRALLEGKTLTASEVSRRLRRAGVMIGRDSVVRHRSWVCSTRGDLWTPEALSKS